MPRQAENSVLSIYFFQNSSSVFFQAERPYIKPPFQLDNQSMQRNKTTVHRRGQSLSASGSSNFFPTLFCLTKLIDKPMLDSQSKENYRRPSGLNREAGSRPARSRRCNRVRNLQTATVFFERDGKAQVVERSGSQKTCL